MKQTIIISLLLLMSAATHAQRVPCAKGFYPNGTPRHATRAEQGKPTQYVGSKRGLIILMEFPNLKFINKNKNGKTFDVHDMWNDLANKENLKAVKECIENVFAEIKAEFAQSDPDAALYVEDIPAAGKHIQPSVMLRAVKALLACPSNVIRMSQTMEGLTETSINMAIVRTEKGKITVHSLMRSAVDSAKAALAQRVRCIFELAEADQVVFKGGYSGWTPVLGTEINKVCMDQYEKVYGSPMKIMATHGGLECAIMGAKYPNWEMASIGPTIKYPHSPDEKVNIASVARTWEYLKAVLANIPNK
jgi:dipeptidase D